MLYLPTVSLRADQNPAFALACRLANATCAPLLVHARSPDSDERDPARSNVTSRRLAFWCEATSEAARDWRARGAGVSVRVDGGPGRRAPDHLTLAHRGASVVVTDEPFVEPWRSYAAAVERACRAAGTPCARVDGSAIAPPRRRLRPNPDRSSPVEHLGVPDKAWRWCRATEAERTAHLDAAADGAFDAPDLRARAADDDDDSAASDPLFSFAVPAKWRDLDAEKPGVAPWSADDLRRVDGDRGGGLKDWAAAWPGADRSVPPCRHTTGTATAGRRRWNDWIGGRGLRDYARKRNDPRSPHSPSRVSCYLNAGVLSIFRLVREVQRASTAPGQSKYLDEIIKWREMSYAHAFSRVDHADAGSIPSFAKRFLDDDGDVDRFSDETTSSPRLTLDRLETGTTGDAKWDAMQRYLVRTGELHNNVRMTWGKTVVQWVKEGRLSWRDGDDRANSARALSVLRRLNDRYALDGLAPPSYAGVLWCLGWCDKPKSSKGAIGWKPASRYRLSPEDFVEAERTLFAKRESPSPSSFFAPLKRKRNNTDDESVLLVEDGRDTKKR